MIGPFIKQVKRIDLFMPNPNPLMSCQNLSILSHMQGRPRSNGPCLIQTSFKLFEMWCPTWQVQLEFKRVSSFE